LGFCEMREKCSKSVRVGENILEEREVEKGGNGRRLTLPGLEDLALPRQSLNIPQQQHTRRTSGSSLEPSSKDSFRLEICIANDVEAADLGTRNGSRQNETVSVARRRELLFSVTHLHHSQPTRSSYTSNNSPLPTSSGSFDENRDLEVVRAHGRDEGRPNDLFEFLEGWQRSGGRKESIYETRAMDNNN